MTVHKGSSLVSEGASELLARPLEDFAELLRSGDGLTDEHLEAIDYALRHSVVDHLVRGASEDELAGVYDPLRRMIPVELETELSEWRLRWRGFADLVDTRLADLAARDPERARRLAHADRILGLVEERPGMTQSEIGEELDLGASNLSRILGVLEAHELIQRRTVGREKRVHLGRLAERPGGGASGASSGREPVQRGIAYLSTSRSAA